MNANQPAIGLRVQWAATSGARRASFVGLGALAIGGLVVLAATISRFLLGAEAPESVHPAVSADPELDFLVTMVAAMMIYGAWLVIGSAWRARGAAVRRAALRDLHPEPVTSNL